MRRISREKSIWWPLSKDIANALQSMRFNAIHEHDKCHPKDWDNPGRVRVEWKKDGRMINPAIKSSAYPLYYDTAEIRVGVLIGDA